MGETGGGTRRDIWRGARGERVGNGGGGVLRWWKEGEKCKVLIIVIYLIYIRILSKKKNPKCYLTSI